jgi:hypothetical protein
MKRWLDLSADEIAAKSAANRAARKTPAKRKAETLAGVPAKLPKIAIPTEHQEQAALVTWWGHYAGVRCFDHRLLFAIPNGSILAGDVRMRSIQSRRLKAEGVRPGMSDLMLAIPRGLLHGLFIEMKRSDWTPPKTGKSYVHHANQVSVIQALRQKRYRAEICAGFDAAKQFIEEYLR